MFSESWRVIWSNWLKARASRGHATFESPNAKSCKQGVKLVKAYHLEWAMSHHCLAHDVTLCDHLTDVQAVFGHFCHIYFDTIKY